MSSSSSSFPLLPITLPRTLLSIKNITSSTPTVIISSYPKSGTTWTQYIVYTLAHEIENKRRSKLGVEELDEMEHISNFSPFLESDKTFTYASNDSEGKVRNDIANNQNKLNLSLFNTHLPKSYVPPNVKYVYLIRNPYDVCLSFYHHMSHQAESDGGYTKSKGEFIREWSNGDIAFGKWGEHLKLWVSDADDGDENVLVMRYEDLKGDLFKCVKRIYSHIWTEDADHLPDDEIQSLLPHLTLESMKSNNEKFTPKSVKFEDKGDGFQFIRNGNSGEGSVGLCENEGEREVIKRAFEGCPEVYRKVYDL